MGFLPSNVVFLNRWRRKLSVVKQGNILFLNQGQSEFNQILALFRLVLPDVTLTVIQETVFFQSWQGKTYRDIAESQGYDPGYIRNVGRSLWQTLSDALGEEVSKNTFCTIIRQRHQQLQALDGIGHASKMPEPEAKLHIVQQQQSLTDWGESPTVPVFVGRSVELAQLEHWILKDHSRLVGIFGLGGVGKTALAAKLVEQLQTQFDCVVWRSLRTPPALDDLIVDLSQVLTGKSLTALPTSSTAKVSLLLQYLDQHRCLLILDDWLSVFQDNQLAGSYQECYEAYGLLLRRISESSHQSCLIITGREPPKGLVFRHFESSPVRSLYLRGLLGKAGREVLRVLGLSDTDANLDRLLDCYSGNPLALRVVVKTILDFFGGSISQFLDLNELTYGEIRNCLDQQFHRLSDLEKRIMYALASTSHQVSLSDLEQKMACQGYRGSLLEALESLYHRSCLQKENASFRQPRILKEYLLRLLSTTPDQPWQHTSSG